MQTFAIEHIEPQKLGGATEIENLALACQGCNNHKYVRIEAPDPIDGKLVRLFHPRRDLWRDHFVWSSDFTEILGRTPCGRATVEALWLNRPGLIQLRRVLFAAGEHPPAEPVAAAPQASRSANAPSRSGKRKR